ncbi:type II toxin-antitoxin system VapC family toxin [Roseofilum sp. BLCC_M154]|uniref:Type II toxin-antitoxin system VapC family toxin n=1 Tax=Roseofilum acuticapitatum BLCC-M154 TaxID=3022444 RepID=A0ABT7AQL2_9CYAN|nr:type II toxin-antitoxin system VapC family toxin [Roseofilum acuticapitatum]MDJ1169203.1 type II toxin-antitoxin system VapC family toxin [Roseofilum acuticapitatum BLCC-M154]
MTTNFICPDANFVVRLVTHPPEETIYGDYWRQWKAADKQIIAPTLFYYEITNAIYRMGRAGQLQEDEVQTALEDVFNLRISIKSDLQLHFQAVALAQQFDLPAAYDAHYLALAQDYRAIFYTGDKRLFNQVHSQFSDIVLVDGRS